MKKLNITFLHKLLAFCLALIVARMIKTGHMSFLFLFWNLLLAWLPVFFIRRIKTGDGKAKKTFFLLLSVLFLPNAPYILTDLFHLKKELVAPLWFDLVLILSFAFLGLIYFIMAFERILRETGLLLPFRFKVLVKPVLLLATGYGIYLGRYLRFNSWDLVSAPVDLASGMFNSVFNPGYYKETFAVTLTFTVFLYLVFEIYLSFKNQLMLNKDGLH